MKLKHKGYGEIEVDEVRRNQSGKIIAVYIKNMGWLTAEEFEIGGENG